MNVPPPGFAEFLRYCQLNNIDPRALYNATHGQQQGFPGQIPTFGAPYMPGVQPVGPQHFNMPGMPMPTAADLKHHANKLKEMGNTAINHGDALTAAEYYTKAIATASEVSNNHEQLKILFSNRSKAMLDLGDYEQAEDDAAQSISLNPSWAKGYLRLSLVHKEKRNFSDAIHVLIDGLHKASKDKDMRKMAFLEHITSMLAQCPESVIGEVLEQLDEIGVTPGEWRALLAPGAQRPNFPLLAWLTQGTQTTPGVVEHFDARHIKLCDIFLHMEEHLVKRFGIGLAISCLKNGAAWQTVEDVGWYRGAPLHAVIDITILYGDLSLIKEIFKNHVHDKAVRNMKDRDGNNLLHIVCRLAQNDFTLIETLLRFLLANGLEPVTVNKEYELPVDLLPKSASSCRSLLQAPINRGEMFQNSIQRAEKSFNRMDRTRAAEVYEQALKIYQDMDASMKQKIPAHTMAEIYHNVALCYVENGNHGKAMHYAELSCSQNKEWRKAHLLWSKLHIEKHGLTDEVKARLLRVYRKCHGVERSAFLQQLMGMTFKYPEIEVKPWLQSFDCGAKVWSDVAFSVGSETKWSQLRQILAFDLLEGANMKKLDYSALVAALSKTDWLEWGEKLVIDLLKKSAHVKHIKNALYSRRPYRCDTVLQGALDLAIWSGSIQLMHYLLRNYHEAAKEVHRRYNDGDTLLHLLCSSRHTQRCLTDDMTIELLTMIAEKGLNIKLKNRYGKRPVDCLPRKDSIAFWFIPGSPQRREPSSKPQSQSRKQTGQTFKESPCSSCITALQSAKAAKQDKTALDRLTPLYQVDHHSKEHDQLLDEAFQFLLCILVKETSVGIPEALVKRLTPDKLVQLSVSVYNGSHWGQLCKLLNLAERLSPPAAGLLKDVDICVFIESKYSSEKKDTRTSLLLKILNQGPNVCSRSGLSPVKKAIEVGDFAALCQLLKKGASYDELTLTEGDTPLHAALVIGLERDPGNFEILKEALAAKEASSDSASQQDTDGNTLFHKLALMPFGKDTTAAAELLLKSNVNPNIPNKEGKTASECLKKTSRLYRFVDMAAKNFPKYSKIASPEGKKSQSEEKGNTVEETRSLADIVKNIEGLIECIQLVEEKQSEEEVYDEVDPEQSLDGIGEVIEHDASESIAGEPSDDDVRNEEQYATSSDDEQEEEGDTCEEIDCHVFDNLPWEVVCAADFWKKLKDKKTRNDLRMRAISRIQQLAKGVWQPSLTKILHHDGPQSVKLFSAKLTKAARIIWEVAITFSPKLSERPEQLLQEEDCKFGRIYSEVIRIWDIVFNHDRIHNAVKKIVRSHSRGEECILQINVESQTKGDHHHEVMGKARYPQLFMEISAAKDKPGVTVQRICPPGSPDPAEYHIMKFYSVNASLLLFLLHNQDISSVDFPFRVTEKEHAIINLNPMPLAPILLLGRSGTGKTTCCLYRLWNLFIKYWHQAIKAKDPLLPRSVCYIYSEEPEDNESSGTADCEEASDHSCEESQEEAGSCRPDVHNDSSGEVHNQQYDHLHQIFVTKNAVLCSEVQKNFLDLCRGTEEAQHYLTCQSPNQNPPNKLQDVAQEGFPLFVTSKQLWLMLDASLGAPYYFDRNENGDMKRDVQGWGDSDTHLTFIPNITDDNTNESEDAEEFRAQAAKPKDPRKEVTYELFALKLWSKINKGKTNYHPTLVWTEIVSFITGSIEALKSKSGFLSLSEYEKLGRKKAPNFAGNREAVYEMYLIYRKLKQREGFFDEADLVRNVFERLRKKETQDWVVHQIYVDETQDFTQAELCLLVHMCQDPNNMFFTGDTAQSIMRGVSFRFEDLKSLFYYAREYMKPLGKNSAIQVPSSIYQLPINYRSHRGILNLASSVVELLERFFPETFDALERDKGLYSGPSPKILQSCDFADLAVLLSGHKRETSQIEFGAHQAVIVVSDDARNNLPEELSYGVVLTIFESKGLEFDDVLLYNFFKDSQARKEWRVVTDYLRQLEEKEWNNNNDEFCQVVHVDLPDSEKPRPLAFAPEQHKVLSSELKHLYTAVTRARVNVWIYDEDAEARAPMFEYFRARNLVECVQVGDASETLTAEVFAKSSSTDQWEAQGDMFFKRHLYHVAVKCYHRSGNMAKMLQCQAHKTAIDAGQLPIKSPQLKNAFLVAAELYLKCKMYNEAEKCLLNARKPLLVARMYMKLGQYQDAAVVFERLGYTSEACDAYEHANRFDLTIAFLRKQNHFAEALDCLQRYQLKLEQLNSDGADVPQALIQHAPSKLMHSKENLCLDAAAYYLKLNKKSLMMEVLDRHVATERKISFLLNNGCIDNVAPLLKEKGRGKEAAVHFREKGRLEDALSYLDPEQDSRLYAEILCARSRKAAFDLQLLYTTALQQEKIPEVRSWLEKSLQLFRICKHWEGVGESSLLLGMITSELTHFISAITSFDQMKRAVAGKADALVEWLRRSNLNEIFEKRKFLCSVLKDIMHLIYMISARDSNSSPLDQEKVQNCYQFYGLVESEGTWVLPKNDFEGSRLRHVTDSLRQSDISSFSVLIKEDLLKKALAIKNIVLNAVETKLVTVQQCPKHKIGVPCMKKSDVYPDDESIIPSGQEGQPVNELDSKTSLDHSATNSESPVTNTKPGFDTEATSSLGCAEAQPNDSDEYFLSEVNTAQNSKVSCSFQHKDESHQDFRLYFECLASKVSVAHAIMDGIHDEDFSNIHEAAQGLELDLWCDQFYHHIFRLSGHPRVMVPIIRDNFRFVRCYLPQNVLLMDALKKYGQRCWETGRKEKRHANSDLWFRVHNINMICGDGFKASNKLLEHEDDWMHNKLKENDNYHALGFRITRRDGIVLRLQNFFWHVSVAFKYIYNNRDSDPLKSIVEFSKLIWFWTNHPVQPLLPNLANYSFICENLLMISACLHLFLDKRAFPLLLPASYTSQIHFTDALYSVHKSTLYNCVNSCKLQWNQIQRELRGRLNAMVNSITGVMCGDFTPLIDALQQQECIESGESERICVLVLTLLCNSGPTELLPVRSESTILSSLCQWNISLYKMLPQRVADALKKAQLAKNRHEVIDALEHLLKERSDEHLNICSWSLQHKGLHFEKMKNLYSLRDHCYEKNFTPAAPENWDEETDIEMDRERQMEKSFEGHSDSVETVLPEIKSDLVEADSPEIKTNDFVALEEDFPEDPMGLNKFRRMDETMCGVCDAVFETAVDTQASEEYDTYDESSTDDGYYQDTAEFRTAGDVNASNASVNPRIHMDSSSHLQNVQSFKDYEILLLRRYVPLKVKIDQFLGKIDQEKEKADSNRRLLEERATELKNIIKRVMKSRSEIEVSRDWGNRRDIDGLLAELGTCYENSEKFYREYINETISRETGISVVGNKLDVVSGDALLDVVPVALGMPKRHLKK